MALMKKIITAIVVVSMIINSAHLSAVSAQDKKKIAERKAQRKKEKTKGKAAAKPKSTKKRATTKKKEQKTLSTKAKAPVTKGSRVTSPAVSTKKVSVSQPAVIKSPVVAPITSTYYGGAETIDVSIPSDISVPTDTYYGGAETVDVSMPTDMPSRLVDELIAMVPANLKNRIENIIMTYSSDASAMLRNIYLLCWIDDELMKIFDIPTFNKMLLEVVSQESGTSYASVETMATDIKNSIDSVFVRFENAIIAGDMNNFEIQQIIDVFKQQEGYREYLDRCLRLATEYNQSKMIVALKLAIANSANVQGAVEEDDFDY